MGVLQAQLISSGQWSVGLRCGGTQRDVGEALTRKEIYRTWLMRGTLHYVSAEDIRWMLALLGSAVIAAAGPRSRQLGLDDAQFARAEAALERELQVCGILSRKDALEVLRCEGLSIEGQRGYHMVQHAALRGLIAFAPRQGTQDTFCLLEETAMGETPRHMDAVIALARRYFCSHGPATAEDFARWSGLKISDTRKALLAMDDLRRADYEGNTVYWAEQPAPPCAPALLLSGFDEYVLAYRDRTVVLDRERENDIVPGGNGMFRNTLVLDGRVAGVWRPETTRAGAVVRVTPFAPLTQEQSAALEEPVRQYGAFLGLPCRWEVAAVIDAGISLE